MPRLNLLYADNVARGRAFRTAPPASTPFSAFLWRKLEDEHLSQRRFALYLGVSPAAMTRWLQGTVRYIPEDAYQRLRDRYGDEVPPMVTKTERSRALALENAAILNAAPTRVRSTRARAGGRAGRGKPKPEHAERMSAWHASPEGIEHRRRLVEADGPRLAGFVTSPEGRSRVSLGQFLRHNPGADVDQIKAHALVVADRLGVTFDEVWGWFRRPLRDRGKAAGPGRPRLSADQAMVDREIAKAKRGAAGQLPPGFWPEMAEKLGKRREEFKSVRRWYYRLDSR